MKNEMSCEKKSPVVPIAVGGVVTLIAAICVLSLFDIIPDFLLGIGQLDDLVAILIGFVTDITVLAILAKRFFETIGSSNTPVNTCTGNFVDAEFVEV